MTFKKYLGFAGGLVGVLGAHLMFSSNFPTMDILREKHPVEQRVYESARRQFYSGLGLVVTGMGLMYTRIKLAPNYKEKKS